MTTNCTRTPRKPSSSSRNANPAQLIGIHRLIADVDRGYSDTYHDMAREIGSEMAELVAAVARGEEPLPELNGTPDYWSNQNLTWGSLVELSLTDLMEMVLDKDKVENMAERMIVMKDSEAVKVDDLISETMAKHEPALRNLFQALAEDLSKDVASVFSNASQ